MKTNPEVLIEIERQGLIDDFIEMVQISSPTGQEEMMSHYVRGRMERLGLTVVQDTIWNVFTRLEGGLGEPLLLNAHLDTVQKPGQSIHPYLDKDGVIRAKDSPILGADNKSTIAVIIGTMRWLQSVPVSQRRPVEVLFTVCEEGNNLGAKKFDEEIKITSKEGLSADYPAPIGSIVLSSPAYGVYNGTFTGQSAHAARPELGLDVTDAFAKTLLELPHGRIDNQTTANRGEYEGGLGRNTIPGEASIRGEVRSSNNDKATSLLKKAEQTFMRNATNGVTAEVTKSLDKAYQYPDSHPLVKRILRIFLDLGINTSYVQGQYCSDVNIFYPEKGIQVVNIGSGERNSHTPQESIEVDQMLKLLSFLKAFTTSATKGLTN